MPDVTPVPSPCINVCRMNSRSGLCEGCWRTIDEIAAWSSASESYKRQVIAQIALRRPEQPSFSDVKQLP